jgi:hypothetical protein
MSDFHFKRLERYKVGGTDDKMELRIPLPQTSSGKVYRWCPNQECRPRLFLLGGNPVRPDTLDISQLPRAPGVAETTCPYCGFDAEDHEFNYEGDKQAILDYIKWAAIKDTHDALEKIANDFNRSVGSGGLISLNMSVKPNYDSEPKAWREDLIRNLACDICGREYGVYAIALFCPDCGSKNLHVHFEREIELILQQIDLAEQVAENENPELSYRILGNAHEDVLTAFETYQKTFYRYEIRKRFSQEEGKKLTSKAAIGNRFQNIDKAKQLYKNLGLDPFGVLFPGEIELLHSNIEKRHVIGHNLSLADETYSETGKTEQPGTTVEILAEDITQFAKTAKKVVLALEQLIEK